MCTHRAAIWCTRAFMMDMESARVVVSFGSSGSACGSRARFACLPACLPLDDADADDDDDDHDYKQPAPAFSTTLPPLIVDSVRVFFLSLSLSLFDLRAREKKRRPARVQKAAGARRLHACARTGSLGKVPGGAGQGRCNRTMWLRNRAEV